jgi:lipopolysaccharide/colanic/teichoic acid biosynthesis glycosyltransferase
MAPDFRAPAVPRHSARDALKRSVDFVVAAAALIVLSPCLIAIGIWVRFDSPGPALYLQDRVGRGGRLFRMFKFRTMCADAETGAPVWPVADDPRSTRAGRRLRRHSLDELPQLWNVLVGDMSLVGPRPERPEFAERFRSRYPDYDQRHDVRGGITGWAQVNGLRGDTSIGHRLAHDLHYIRARSLAFDARIILQTFRVVFPAERLEGIREPHGHPQGERYLANVEHVVEEARDHHRRDESRGDRPSDPTGRAWVFTRSSAEAGGQGSA